MENYGFDQAIMVNGAYCQRIWYVSVEYIVRKNDQYHLCDDVNLLSLACLQVLYKEPVIRPTPKNRHGIFYDQRNQKARVATQSDFWLTFFDCFLDLTDGLIAHRPFLDLTDGLIAPAKAEKVI